jgi:predicted nucleic acid-binding protein
VILVDSSVWIDLFRDQANSQVLLLEKAIFKRSNICVCGIILMELLMGIRNPKEHQRVKNNFQSLNFLDTSYETYLLASDLFRSLRQRGITIRKSVDCIIAAIAIENELLLLHNDKDFQPIEKYCGLNVLH